MINKLPVTFLMTFGHCGIDWLHSLLNSNPRILIMPALSFYRILYFLDIENTKDKKKIYTRLKKYFIEVVGFNSKNKQKKIFSNKSELEIFIAKLEIRIDLIKTENFTKKDIFFAIHEAYAEAKKFDANGHEVLVSHEHMPWPLEKITKDFPDSKILMIIRDPRASIAGLFHGRKKYFGHLPDYTFNEAYECWLYSQKMYFKLIKKNKKNFFIVRNEDMHGNLEVEIKKICQWMNIGYDISMLQGTFEDNTKTRPDTLYIDAKDINFDYDNYYLPNNVEKRWRGELKSTNFILVTEAILYKIMRDFNYKLDNQINIKNKLLGYLYFIYPNKYLIKRLNKKYPDLDEFKKVEDKLVRAYPRIVLLFWQILPNYLKYLMIILRSILMRLKILYLPSNTLRKYYKKLRI